MMLYLVMEGEKRWKEVGVCGCVVNDTPSEDAKCKCTEGSGRCKYGEAEKR